MQGVTSETLTIDLAAMFEPDEEAVSIEVTNILKYDSYE